MTAILVVLTIIVAVTIDVALVSYRRRHAVAAETATSVAMHEPTVPQGLFLGREHVWARLTSEGTLRLGVDDLVAQAAGRLEAIVTPARGTEVKRGDVIATVKTGGRTLAVRAPVDGRIVHVNDGVLERPWLVERDPYGAGWMVAMWSRDLKEALQPMRVGAAAVAFLREELVRLSDFLVARGRLATAPVLADGGLPRSGAVQALDDEQLEAFQKLFLDGAEEA